MRALVTGGAGFIGSHLVELLLEKGHEVIVLDDLSRGKKENLEKILHHPKFSLQKKDICAKKEIAPFFEGVDWVFHLAALAAIVPSVEVPESYFSVNVEGTFAVLECARKARVGKFLYAASSSCYGLSSIFPTPETAPIAPEYPYALTKYLGEELVLHWGKVYQLPVISLRLFNVYGLRARTSGAYGALFGVFMAQKLHGKPFTVVGNGEQTRDFIFVTDVARAFYEAACSDLKQEVINVGSSHHYSINQIVKLLGGEVVFLPKRPGEPDCTFADVGKIKTLLGWQARVSLEEGVKILLENIDSFREAPLWDPKSIHEATKSWFHHLGEKQSV